MIDINFTFIGKCWLWQGKGTWHFITLPQDKSEEIKFFSDNHFGKRRGWGSVRVSANIGGTIWETSIFPSGSLEAYILPIKAEVRKKQKIVAGDDVEVLLQISI
ncbi:DUF1905 domain-containing protein [Methylotenera versatilis]|uniref:DUF1905 domain-containing protein n=1 Tax=Methylotenera versatilis (strain 301) TaxID=666681 RepID=D7DMY6_METV0|nr:DUF1905 domain-containing protein [Methylotenera versatilis]ADI28925.1 Domain of unknown function DUF1905 [Methylotenera versatilis 301]